MKRLLGIEHYLRGFKQVFIKPDFTLFWTVLCQVLSAFWKVCIWGLSFDFLHHLLSSLAVQAGLFLWLLAITLLTSCLSYFFSSLLLAKEEPGNQKTRKLVRCREIGSENLDSEIKSGYSQPSPEPSLQPEAALPEAAFVILESIWLAVLPVEKWQENIQLYMVCLISGGFSVHFSAQRKT